MLQRWSRVGPIDGPNATGCASHVSTFRSSVAGCVRMHAYGGVCTHADSMYACMYVVLQPTVLCGRLQQGEEKAIAV